MFTYYIVNILAFLIALPLIQSNQVLTAHVSFVTSRVHILRQRAPG